MVKGRRINLLSIRERSQRLLVREGFRVTVIRARARDKAGLPVR